MQKGLRSGRPQALLNLYRVTMLASRGRGSCEFGQLARAAPEENAREQSGAEQVFGWTSQVADVEEGAAQLWIVSCGFEVAGEVRVDEPLAPGAAPLGRRKTQVVADHD